MYLAEYLLSIREFLEEYPTGENVSNENTAGQRLSYGLLPEKGQAEKILSYGFSEEEYREALVERAFSCIDEERKKKAERIRPGRARAASLGAGLLLQLAVGEVLREILWRWERRFTGMCPEALRRATSQILKGQLTGKRNILYIPSANC